MSQDIPGEFLVTFDACTLKASDPYLVVTTHYIDMLPGKPNDWMLKSELLEFKVIEGNHGRVNMATTMMKVIDQFGLHAKVISPTFFIIHFINHSISHSLDGLLLRRQRVSINLNDHGLLISSRAGKFLVLWFITMTESKLAAWNI